MVGLIDSSAVRASKQPYLAVGRGLRDAAIPRFGVVIAHKDLLYSVKFNDTDGVGSTTLAT